MDLHKKLYFSTSSDLFSTNEELVWIPKYLSVGDKLILNPEYHKDDPDTEEALRILDEIALLDDTPATINRPAPVPHASADTPEEWAEIDAVFSEIGIMPTVPDSPAAQHDQKQPEIIPPPALPVQEPEAAPDTPQAEPETDFALLSIDTLLSLQKSHFSGDFTYTNTEQSLNRNIALELTKRGISPIERGFPKYNWVACKTPAISAYMLDLQIFDLLWLWHTQNGHQTDSAANDGLFDGIFTSDQFDFEKAHKIAIGRYETKTGKVGHLTAIQKIKHLRLPECWQEQLVVLRSGAIRQRQDEAKNKAQREQEKLDRLRVRAIDIRHKLDKYAKTNPVDTKIIDMNECVNIWVALQYSGGKISNLSGIMAAYEKLSGDSIGKSKLRRRVELFKRASIL